MGRLDAINYEDLLDKVMNVTGVDTWHQSTKKKIAEQTGVSEISITRLFKDLQELDAYETRAIAGGFRQDGTPIRRQEYKITNDWTTITNRAHERNFKWGKAYNRTESDRRAKKAKSEYSTGPGRGKAWPLGYSTGEVQLHETSVVEEPPVPGWTVKRVEDSPFSVLRPLRKDEAAALIEAARQYQDTMSFIDEEIARFEARGITLDPATIGFPRDERLAVIGQVVEYVSSLEKRIERLQEKASGSAEVGGLKEAIRVKEDTIRDLMRQRERTDEEVRRTANQWSGERATYNQRIEMLEQENHSLRMLVANPNGTSPEPARSTP